MKIGLLGYGVVGKGVYDIIMTYFQDKIEVKKILDLNFREEVSHLLVKDINDIINDEEITLVVEAIGGINIAYEFITSALKNKKHVVTSNKAVVAQHLEEFHNLALKNNVSFKYEASVCGGIPWISSLEKAQRIDEIEEIFGIFNGTSNFILDNMTKNGYNFQEVLSLAQTKGYAESDPSADIDGVDIMRKLLISSSLGFKTIIPESDINVFGIRNINTTDIEYFKSLNSTFKLLALGKKQKDKYALSVEPAIFSNDTLEANVPSNFNIGSIKGHTIGELKFYGQGAGDLPTGNAIVQDVLDIMETKNIYPKDFSSKLSNLPSLIQGKYYVRTDDKSFYDSYSHLIEETINFKGSLIYITKIIDSELIHKATKDLNNVFYAKFNF